MAECIHGFDEGLCDVCYPRTQAPPPRVTRPAATRAPRTGAATRVAAVSAAPATLRLPGRRVHHVTHLRTLESIALDGELRADAVPDVDVSSATTRELRASATVPDGRSVASFVAFHLAQDSTRWEELRGGAVGAHWSDAARAARPTDFVIISVPVDALGDDVVFADGDAAAVATRFAAGVEAGTQALRRLHALDLPAVAALDPVMAGLSRVLGQVAKQRPGRQHMMDAAYFARVDAIHYTIAHDDGQLAEEWEEADILLAGVSRSSKTPTSIYLANRGFKTANIPLVPESPPPANLYTLQKPLVVGLTASPDRQIQIRRNRLIHLGSQEPTDYVDPDAVARETAFARRIFADNDWPVIDVTRRSIEETAAAIINLHQKRQESGLVPA